MVLLLAVWLELWRKQVYPMTMRKCMQRVCVEVVPW